MKQGWEIRKLGEVCEFRNGAAHEQFIDEEGRYILINSKFISADGEKLKRTNEALSPLFVNDIAFVMSDVPNGKALAKCFLVDKDDTYTLNQRIGAIKSEAFLPEFLVYQFNRNKYLLSFDNGENQTNLRKNDILNCPLLIPPLPEQKQIVSILDEAFAAIAKAKANTEQNLKNAKELFESYLQGVFENGNWEMKIIQEITKIINGYAFASRDFKPTNTVKSVKITNVGVKEFIEEADNYLPERFKETLKDFQVREGNIVIALTRTIISAGLKVAVVPASYDGALINQRVAALVPNEKLVNQNFLYFYLATIGVANYVLEHVNTLMQPNLSINDLKNMPVPCPSLKEQNMIVHQLETLRAETQKLEALYQKKIDDLEELKKSILQKAFEGELKTEKVVAL